MSGSSVHMLVTSVSPGHAPPHRVSCSLSKSLDVCWMVKVSPGGTSAKNTFSGAAPWPPRPTLQPEECDAAVWVTPGDLEVGGIRGYDAKGEPIEIEAAQIAGIYPNSIGEGIAQGNRWALETLAGS